MAEMAIELPDECWELIFTKLGRVHYLEELSLVSKQFFLIINLMRTYLTVVSHSIPYFSLLLRRFSHLQKFDFTAFNGELDQALCEIAGSSLEIKELNISNKINLPLKGLRDLGLKKRSLSVLKCSNVHLLSDKDLVLLSIFLPWLEEIDLSNLVRNEDLDCSLFDSSVTDNGIEHLSINLKGLRKIDISGNYQLSDRSLIALSSNCVLLREIKFRGCCFLTQNGIEFVIRHCCNLVALNVNGCDMHVAEHSASSSFAIGRSIFHGRSLRELELFSMVVPDEVLRSISEARLPLKKFSLCHCSSFTFYGMCALLRAYQHLSELDIEGTSFLTDEHMIELSQFLCNITSIKLSWCMDLTSASLFALASNCRWLVEVVMENTSLGREDLCVDLRKNCHVRNLKVGSNSYISDELLEKFGFVFPNLRVLDLSNCRRITDKGIACVLGSCRDITHMDLSTCEGVSLVDMGDTCGSLEVLKAGGSGIDDLGLEMVGKLCGRLVVLDLKSCFRVTVKGVNEVVKRCKSLREINMSKCCNMTISSLSSIVFSGRNLRKVVLPCSCMSSESEKMLYMRHGCMILDESVVF